MFSFMVRNWRTLVSTRRFCRDILPNKLTFKKPKLYKALEPFGWLLAIKQKFFSSEENERIKEYTYFFSIM